MDWVAEVTPGDAIRGGVAVRANDRGLAAHPYTFREVCKNGAIVAEAVGTFAVAFDEFEGPDEAVDAATAAVASCARPEAFEAAVRRMRSSREVSADLMINLMPMLASLEGMARRRLTGDIVSRFLRGEDESLYGLFNAVTAAARDETDPALKWRLEELGGGLIAGRKPIPAPGGTWARELVTA